MERKQGQRIAYYKDNKEKAAILEELKLEGFKCKNISIDLTTSAASEIEQYIHGMLIGIDFERRIFFSTSVTIAINGVALGIGAPRLLEILKNKQFVEPHPSITIV